VRREVQKDAEVLRTIKQLKNIYTEKREINISIFHFRAAGTI
jgi:hypothetical protein